MKPTIAMSWLLSIALLTLTSSVYTQNREEPGENDPGVDVAVVIATKANLREGPGTSSRVIKELNRGEMLALVKRTPVGPWYDVIDVRSSTEGWINGNTIRIKYTERKKAGPVFEERQTGTSDDPSIEVTNDSDRVLYLKVEGDERIVISPHATRKMTKRPGTYSFYASSPGVIPAFGQHDFRSGIIYQWTFYIVTTFK